MRMALRDILDMIFSVIKTAEPVDILDILVLSYVVYLGMKLVRETRAGQLLKGVFLLILVYIISAWINMKAISYLLSETLNIGLIALIILFQPELRRTLEKAADNDGVALSVSVPPEPLTPFHVHVRVRVAAALMEDVPPLAAIVAGLADTVTFQALHDAYCLFPADWVIVQLADLPAWVAVYVILRVLVEVLLPALTVFPDRLNPAALPEMTGVAVSVPVFTPLVYTSRAAEQVSVDVPPAAAIVVGLADMFTFQSP